MTFFNNSLTIKKFPKNKENGSEKETAPVEELFDVKELKSLYDSLSKIWLRMEAFEKRFEEEINAVQPGQKKSIRNLLHYLALRKEDMRNLQTRLARFGLSSLGRVESHTMYSLEHVMNIINQLLGGERQIVPHNSPVSHEEGKEILVMNTQDLLGKKPGNRPVRIMVTMPSHAGEDYPLVRSLMKNGMDVMRINCAHDDATVWQKMIINMRRAERELSRECKIFMDLAGPKIRTGAISPGPQVVKFQPKKDSLGRVIEPARVWLVPDDSQDDLPLGASAKIPVNFVWLQSLKIGDVIRFMDVRGKKRKLTVVAEDAETRWAECEQTTFIEIGTPLYCEQKGEDKVERISGKVGALPYMIQTIQLFQEDELVLTREQIPGENASFNKKGKLNRPAHIACTASQIFDDVKKGESIWFDDGKIGGLIISVKKEKIIIKITHAPERGAKLASDKGINLPDSELKMPSLTQKDIKDLQFIAANADLLGYSFVRKEKDVFHLQSELKKLNAKNMGIVLKIETRGAFENIPKLLMAGMRNAPLGVMIARGDLAVECGYERMAEIQEELLWVCESAHVPIIWATQVLENLAKTGKPSRAEITDASMGVRAEGVMLNKGPFIVDALTTLDDILRRMSRHQDKSRAMMRPLRLSSLD